jgi:hypothetical protein
MQFFRLDGFEPHNRRICRLLYPPAVIHASILGVEHKRSRILIGNLRAESAGLPKISAELPRPPSFPLTVIRRARQAQRCTVCRLTMA